MNIYCSNTHAMNGSLPVGILSLGLSQALSRCSADYSSEGGARAHVYYSLTSNSTLIRDFRRRYSERPSSLVSLTKQYLVLSDKQAGITKKRKVEKVSYYPSFLKCHDITHRLRSPAARRMPYGGLWLAVVTSIPTTYRVSKPCIAAMERENILQR